MKQLKQYHLEKDLKLPKITLQRWLEDHQSFGERCEVEAVLLSRWTRWYTAAEIKTLLKLGTRRYRGFKGISPGVLAAQTAHITAERRAIVKRTLALLK